MIQDQITEKEQSQQFIKEILSQIITDITRDPFNIGELSITDAIPHLYNTNYKVNQVKCYQQHSSNLCGYHAIFNAFCFLKLLNKENCIYHLQSCASFWKFKTQVQKFLFMIKQKKNMPDQWPWRSKDILQGDFQRVYYKVSMQQFEEFKIFKNHQNFTLLTHTWPFQFGNLLLEEDSQFQLEESFQLFKTYKGSKPMVLHLMLGITTHWLTFFAVKKDQLIQYWYFDSQNCLTLDYSWQEIVQYIQKQIKQSIKYGKKQPTKFQKQSDCQCLKDIQSSLKLITNCLQGKQTLASFAYNRKFQTWGIKLSTSLDSEEKATQVIRQYQFDIRQFLLLKIQWELLSNENKKIMKSIIDGSQRIKQFSEQGCFLYELISMQNDFV